MIFSIILWASIIWTAPLICYMLVNETKFKKNIVIGVTLPYEAREDEQVQRILERFKKQQISICIILIVIAVPCLFVRGMTVSFTLWCTWVDLLIILPNIPYVLCNRTLKKLKLEKGWKREESKGIWIDTEVIPPNRWLTPWVFLPAVLLCLLPLIWDRSFWPLYVTFAACPALFWLCYRYLYRNKSETVDRNVELSRVLTQVRRYNWGKMWLVCAYSFSALGIGTFFTRNYPVWNIILIISFGFVVSVAAIRIEMNTRKVQERLTAQSGKDWYVDDDDKWIGGIIYYNPNDSRLVINNRIGTNSSINVARTSGKILMGSLILLILAMPFTGVLLGSIGNREIGLELTETYIVSTCGSSEYTVAFEEIEKAELLEKLPDNMIRTYGTGMENLLRGNFSAEGIGEMKVCLDPNHAPFILITTHGNKHYLFGSRDAGLTNQIYDQLELKLDRPK